VRGYGKNSKGPETGSEACFCEHCNEILESIKSGELIDQLRNFSTSQENLRIIGLFCMTKFKKKWAEFRYPCQLITSSKKKKGQLKNGF
jgi:hypothetical protein